MEVRQKIQRINEKSKWKVDIEGGYMRIQIIGGGIE